MVITQALTPSDEKPPCPSKAACKARPTGIARPAPAQDHAHQAVEEQMDGRGTKTHVDQRRHEERRRQQGDAGDFLVADPHQRRDHEHDHERQAARDPPVTEDAVEDMDRQQREG